MAKKKSKGFSFFHILYGVIGLIAVFLAFQIYSVLQLKQQLVDVPSGYYIGEPSADVKIVEFLNYTCHYCHQVHPAIMGAVKEDGNVLFIPRPVVSSESPGSEYAARFVYAAGKQGKFIEAHEALLERQSIYDDVIGKDIAERLDLDFERLQIDMQSKEVFSAFAVNGDMFQSIGGRGTPTFLINDQIVFEPEGSLPTKDDFLKMFEENR